ncbi:hypothetical protein HanRHA438_Chr02g0051711 [Helianthus annuus]|nr:hypothetical protein HanRHA438_Chr02g0051711 [Helianthus annuus]
MADDCGGTIDSWRPMVVLRWRTALGDKVVWRCGHSGVLHRCRRGCTADVCGSKWFTQKQDEGTVTAILLEVLKVNRRV